MAKKRTFKEKQQAKIARQQKISAEVQQEAHSGVSYSLHSDLSSKKVAVTGTNLLRIDSKYIVRDLVKTLLISGVLFTLLIGIYFYLGYN